MLLVLFNELYNVLRNLHILISTTFRRWQVQDPVLADQANVLDIHGGYFAASQNAVQHGSHHGMIAHIGIGSGIQKLIGLLRGQDNQDAILVADRFYLADQLSMGRVFLDCTKGFQPVVESTDGRYTTPDG